MHVRIVGELKQYSKCVQDGTVYHAPACPANCAYFLCLVSATKDVLIFACLCIVCMCMYVHESCTHICTDLHDICFFVLEQLSRHVSACIMLCFDCVLCLPWGQNALPPPSLCDCAALSDSLQGTMGKLIKQLSKHDSPGTYVCVYIHRCERT